MHCFCALFGDICCAFFGKGGSRKSCCAQFSSWLDLTSFANSSNTLRPLWCNGKSPQLWRCQQILPFTRNAMRARYWVNGTPSAVQSLVSVSMRSPLPSQWILGVGGQNHFCALQLFRKVPKWRTRRTFGDDWELCKNHGLLSLYVFWLKVLLCSLLFTCLFSLLLSI